ncbi:hypothetical protein OG607_41380 [Streptomyces sp. NBC_01537]|uniref:hypothetical protein n=1 Tax=Streptomyces sp. NBC_01537 TaxID=2903896 RepID=UPI0038658D9A
MPDAWHLIDEIQALLDPLREMHRRHQAALDEHRDTDGAVIEARYAAYEEARRSTALEASDVLHTVAARMELLVAVPAHRAFTVALNGPGHAEGASPWLFVVNGTDLDDAHCRLAELPSFRRWLDDIRNPDDSVGTRGDAEIVTGQSHAGVPAPGSYVDLRREQARVLADRTASSRASQLPVPGSPCPAPQRSR